MVRVSRRGCLRRAFSRGPVRCLGEFGGEGLGWLRCQAGEAPVAPAGGRKERCRLRPSAGTPSAASGSLAERASDGFGSRAVTASGTAGGSAEGGLWPDLLSAEPSASFGPWRRGRWASLSAGGQADREAESSCPWRSEWPQTFDSSREDPAQPTVLGRKHHRLPPATAVTRSATAPCCSHGWLLSPASGANTGGCPRFPGAETAGASGASVKTPTDSTGVLAE